MAAENGMRPKRKTVGVVTVTYNGDRFFKPYMEALQKQSWSPDLVVLVDSGSSDPSYLAQASAYSVSMKVIYETNVGFCAGCNIGWRLMRDFDYILFLNPDAFLAPDFIERAVEYMEASPEVGMVGPSLIRYDIFAGTPLEIIDTTGIVRGRGGWPVDRDQGEPVSALAKYTKPNVIPWICAAAVLVKREALNSIVEPGDQLFDESFVMYKDDVDLSWRMRRAGWKIVHHPGLSGYHCRGWKGRGDVSRAIRLLSARNEVKVYYKQRSPFILIGLIKYVYVRFLEK